MAVMRQVKHFIVGQPAGQKNVNVKGDHATVSSSSSSSNAYNAPISTITRSTGTVHTSAKARLGFGIRIRYSDRHQNLIICSLAHCQPFMKISCKIRSEVFAQSC